MAGMLTLQCTHQGSVALLGRGKPCCGVSELQPHLLLKALAASCSALHSMHCDLQARAVVKQALNWLAGI